MIKLFKENGGRVAWIEYSGGYFPLCKVGKYVQKTQQQRSEPENTSKKEKETGHPASNDDVDCWTEEIKKEA